MGTLVVSVRQLGLVMGLRQQDELKLVNNGRKGGGKMPSPVACVGREMDSDSIWNQPLPPRGGSQYCRLVGLIKRGCVSFRSLVPSILWISSAGWSSRLIDAEVSILSAAPGYFAIILSHDFDCNAGICLSLRTVGELGMEMEPI